jgi:hypothetical protein
MTIPVTVAANIPANTDLQNIAYICAENVTTNPTGPNGEVVCGNTNPPPPPPTGQCDRTTPTSQRDPACIAVLGNRCNALVSNPSGATQAPGTSVAYECSATGTSLVAANLEYRITCPTDTTPTGYLLATS